MELFLILQAIITRDSIWQFQYKEVNLIPGFDDAIGLLSKDAEGDFIIPSELAYGTSGYNGIPPYTPLFFFNENEGFETKRITTKRKQILLPVVQTHNLLPLKNVNKHILPFLVF